MRKLVLKVGLLSIVLASLNLPVSAQVTGTVMPNFDKPWATPKSFFEPPEKAFPDHLKYGPKHWQTVDFFAAKKGTRAPLVFVLNDVSDWGRYRLHSEGFAVASLGRMPSSTMKAPERLANAIEAIAYVRRKAAELGFDEEKIAIYGPGKAANFAFLLGTDPTLLEGAGVPFESIRAVVTGNGSGFDIPKRISESSFKKQQYEKDFGTDAAEQLRFSPIAQLAPPNAPGFLMFVTEDAVEIRPETDEMVAVSLKAGLDVRLLQLPRVFEDLRRTYFLAEPDGSGKELVPFLREKFGEQAR